MAARSFDDGDGTVCDMFEPHVKPSKRLCVAAADRRLTGGSMYLLTVEHITFPKRQLNCCAIRLDRWRAHQNNADNRRQLSQVFGEAVHERYLFCWEQGAACEFCDYLMESLKGVTA